MPGKSLVYLPRLRKTVLICLLLVPFAAASDHWDYEESHSDVRDFVSGGSLHVRLSVGDLRILRSDSNKIQLHYTVKSRHESGVKDAHVDFEVRGNDANIEFHTPGSNTQVDVDLKFPRTRTSTCTKRLVT